MLAALTVVNPVVAAAQDVDEPPDTTVVDIVDDSPSPTVPVTEPEVSVSQTEETSATETRLRRIVTALVGLGVVILIVNLLFWLVTRPGRRAEAVAGVADSSAGAPTPVSTPAVAPSPSPTAIPEIRVIESPHPNVVDHDALDAARSLFDRLGDVPEMDR